MELALLWVLAINGIREGQAGTGGEAVKIQGSPMTSIYIRKSLSANAVWKQGKSISRCNVLSFEMR